LATIDVLAKVIALTGMLTDGANVRGLVVGRMTNLSLQYGNSDGSCLAYVLFGSMAGAQFDNQGDGNRFARLGIELVERRNLRRFQGRTYRTFAENVSLWTEHIGIGCNLLRQGFEAAKRTGEAAYAAYIVETLTRLLLASGQSLAEVQLETELGLEFATTTRVEFVVDLMSQRLAFIKALRGLTANVSSYPENFGAASSESDTVIDQQKLVARSFFCVGVLKACYHAGDYSAALDASRGAEPLLSIPTAFVERAEYHFYAGLCHAASIALAGVEERGRHIDALMAHQRQIAIWAIQCPDNFENRAVLLSAEVARIEGRELDAETLYERAIHLARLKRFHHNEAIASELAAAFHTARGLPTIANAYLREARSCYRRWGAESKVRQLDARYPQLRQSAADNTASIATQIEHLDFATVVKVSHALSGELVLDKLIDVLMRLAIEHAGAERGVLLLVRGDQLLQESEGITSRNGIVVRRQDGAAAVLPDAIVQYVMRTREIVIIDDAASDPTYSRDQYVIKRRTRSVLCLPLVNDTRLNGVLYLENGLAAAVFTPDRTAILKLLASQAAVSLENTYLYRDLAQAIEHLRKAEIHLAGEKRVLEMIASGQRLRDVLAALCKFFEDSVPDCYCGIYPIDARSNTFEYGVAPSLPASYTEAVDGLSLAFDDSPRGRSTSNKLQVVAEDIGSDPRWSDAPCRLHVLKHGLRAVWSTPILSRDGSVIGTVCVYQQTPGGPSADHQEVISHIVRLASIAIVRSQAETALKRSETFLTEGQRISLTGSFSWRVDNDELRFSQQLRRIFEFDANEEITLQMMRDRIHPDDLPILSEKQAQVRSGQNDHEYDIRLRMPVGDVKYLRVFGRAIRHEDGHIEYLGAAQDVSRRRLAEEARDKVRSELARVSRVVSLGALTASIAHEINQPIASIITNGETGLRWLKREEPNLTKIEDALKRVIGDAKRGAKIVDGIRTMASRGSSRHSEINLTEVVAASIAFVQHELQMRNVSISLEDQADLPIVLGDRTQLQQVIINLVLNAAQALTKAGLRKNSIAVRLQKIEGMVCCVVEDSGSGIDLEHLPHLFDSFFTTKETGMGLGLQITQSIIEAHGGHIAGDNSSVLGGARFTFRLPVVSDQARAPN
jgi:PAS domain S-box-containing protein